MQLKGKKGGAEPWAGQQGDPTEEEGGSGLEGACRGTD